MKAKVSESVTPGSQVVCGMCLKFVYTNTISALEQREVQTADILIPIDVVLGKAE